MSPPAPTLDLPLIAGMAKFLVATMLSAFSPFSCSVSLTSAVTVIRNDTLDTTTYASHTAWKQG